MASATAGCSTTEYDVVSATAGCSTTEYDVVSATAGCSGCYARRRGRWSRSRRWSTMWFQQLQDAGVALDDGVRCGFSNCRMLGMLDRMLCSTTGSLEFAMFCFVAGMF
jgi:hypothetical protein